MASHTFSRQELYDLVWSEPMLKLAAKYGMSGRGLAKACARADIPVPERGYWARVEAGQKLTKPDLPLLKPGTLEQVTIAPPEPRVELPPPPPPPPALQAKIDAELRPEAKITVPATLTNPHRIIAAWLQEKKRQRQQHRHDPWSRRMHHAVDEIDLDKRRLRLLSALFKALEVRGYKLIVENQYRHQVLLATNTEKLTIDAREREQQKRRPLTEDEKAKHGYLSTGQRWTQERHKTGELILTIKHVNRYDAEKSWRDEPEQKLEDKLNQILADLVVLFEDLRLKREREAAERTKQMELEQQRHQREMEYKREIVRYRRLLGKAEDWQQAENIRAFVAAIAASPNAKEQPEITAQWTQWALAQADRLDPLKDEKLFNLEVTDTEVYTLSSSLTWPGQRGETNAPNWHASRHAWYR